MSKTKSKAKIQFRIQSKRIPRIHQGRSHVSQYKLKIRGVF